MLDAQATRDAHEPVALATSCGALGGVKTSDRFSRVASEYRGRHTVILVSGVPTSTSSNGAVDARLRRAADLDFEQAVAEIEALDGAFAALVWSESARKLAIVTDILGMQPIYLH